MVPRRHGVGCLFLQKSDKPFEVLAFPGAHVTIKERALIVQAQRGRAGALASDVLDMLPAAQERLRRVVERRAQAD